MIIFQIIAKLYSSTSNAWINDLDDNMIQPMVINKFLLMNDELVYHARTLNKYTFTLKPKEWLCLANVLIPKKKYKYSKYLKAVEGDERYLKLFDKVRTKLKMCDSDWNSYKKYFLAEFEKDKEAMFRILGMSKKDWKKAGLDFAKIKEGEKRQVKSGLDMFM